MTTKIKNNVFLFGLTILFLSFSCKTPEPHGLPKNWLVAGSHPASYIMGTDNSISKTDDYSAIIKSSVDKVTGFGTLMQQCSPDKFAASYTTILIISTVRSPISTHTQKPNWTNTLM
jgi:hypothetical protein